MATYTWASAKSGDWITAANWTPAAVPNDPTATVVIDNATTSTYDVTVGAGEFWTVGSVSLNAATNLLATNRNPYEGGILSIDGTLNFGTGSAGNISGSLQSFVLLNGGTILNPGTIDGFVQGQAGVLLTGTNGLYITNILQAAGNVVTLDTKSIAELTGNTLFDGIFDAQGTGGVINFGGPRQNLITNIATIVGPPALPTGWTEITFSGSVTAIGEWNGTSYVPLESTLTTIGTRGTMDVESGRNYITPNTLTVTGGGMLNLRAGQVSVAALDINSGSVVQGSANITAGIINNGTLRALDGTLTTGTAGLVGTGIVTFDYDQQVGTVAATGAVMEVHGVGPGQTFIMNGKDTLVLDTPASFAGTIAAKAGDTILLGGVGSATSASVVGQRLNLTNAAGQVVYGLNVSGSYTGDTFVVTPLGGGTSTQVQVRGAAAATAASAATIIPTPLSLNLVSNSATFTSTGSVSTVVNGGNVSSFLTGTSADETFVVDARNPSSSTFSTIAGLQSGDNVVILGMTPSDFSVNLVNDVGAPGYTGLTLALSSPNQPTVNVDLAGYSTSDLLNGRLSQAFSSGTDASGTPYLLIHAT